MSAPDLSNTTNALLVQAETAVLGLNNPLIQTCVLRLGGIYGPGKDIPSFIRSASGQPVPKNGNHINAWVHLDDIVRGVDFALQRRLRGIYNLVDDLQLTRRELSNALCDDEGLPPVIWENHDRPGARGVQRPRLQCPPTSDGLLAKYTLHAGACRSAVVGPATFAPGLAAQSIAQ